MKGPQIFHPVNGSPARELNSLAFKYTYTQDLLFDHYIHTLRCAVHLKYFIIN